MSKKVLLVGHCGPDSSYLRLAVRAAAPDSMVTTANDDCRLQLALEGSPDLLLVNRALDGHFSAPSGIELIESLRQTHRDLKMMLISNYPEAQQRARAAGALPGFGKSDLRKPQTIEVLKGAL